MITKNSILLGLFYDSISTYSEVGIGADVQDAVFTPPANEIWKVINLKYYASPPSSGSSTEGTHTVYTSVFTLPDVSYDTKIQSNWNVACYFASGTASGTTVVPALLSDFQRAILNTVCCNAKPLVFKYYNDTDAATTQNRNYHVIFEKYRLVE